jgi:hypothetical protein
MRRTSAVACVLAATSVLGGSALASSQPAFHWLRPSPGHLRSAQPATIETTGAIAKLGATTVRRPFGAELTSYFVTVGGTTCSLNGWNGILQVARPLAVGQIVVLRCADGRVSSIVPTSR